MAAVSPAMPNEAGDLWIVQVTPETAPATTRPVTSSPRSATRRTSCPRTPNIKAHVTGQTAVDLGTADRLAEALPMYIGVVISLAPAADGRVPLDPGAAEGGHRAPAQHRGVSRHHRLDLPGTATSAACSTWQPPARSSSFLPILLIGILFGLAMDYEVFLVSRCVSVSCTRATPRTRSSTPSRQRPRRDRGGHDHDGRLRRVILSPDPIIKSIGLSLAVASWPSRSSSG